MPYHSEFVGTELHVPGYMQGTDPGAVGAGKYWIDTSGGSGSWELKVRNAADTGWETIASGGGSDHGSLSGLGDDDHSQYALLAGRAGNTLIMADNATTPPWRMTERSSVPSSPSTGDMYLDDGTNTGSGNPGFRRYTGAAWEDVSAGGGGGGLYESYVHLCEEQTQNTNGGTFTSGAWRTRTLNTETDPDEICTLSSNQFTLDAGTYIIRATAPAYRVGMHQTRLYNTTGSTTLLTGTSEKIVTGYSSPHQTRSVLSGRFTVTASQVLELQHYCTTTFASQGFGWPANITTEVYTEVEIWKEA